MQINFMQHCLHWVGSDPVQISLSPLPVNPVGLLDVFGHDGDSLDMDGAQVDVLQQIHKLSLAGLLQRHNSQTLEAQVGPEVLRDLTDQVLEGQLPD